MNKIKAIIVDDEAPLRVYLRSRLMEIWPALEICGEAENGIVALELIQAYDPDIAFLDIRMPGLSGLEVAQRIQGKCRVVFITAYDQYAVQAFEDEAMDYILKPVSAERLEMTVKRLQNRISSKYVQPRDAAEMVKRVMAVLNTNATASQYLKWIKAQHRDGIRLIPVDEVICFKAGDKYTTVVTNNGEFLIKKPIKDLCEELDPGAFWRIHRGTIVNVICILKVSHSLTGRHVLKLKGLDEPLTVSRSYAYLFKQM